MTSYATKAGRTPKSPEVKPYPAPEDRGGIQNTGTQGRGIDRKSGVSRRVSWCCRNAITPLINFVSVARTGSTLRRLLLRGNGVGQANEVQIPLPAACKSLFSAMENASD